jgi:hypothetical protein
LSTASIRESLIRLAAVVFVDHPGGGRRLGVDDVVGLLADAHRLAFVVIEGEVHAFHVGKVGGDVAVGDLDHPVLHVLGVDELDLVDEIELLEDGGAHQPVEVAARDQPEFP